MAFWVVVPIAWVTQTQLYEAMKSAPHLINHTGNNFAFSTKIQNTACLTPSSTGTRCPAAAALPPLFSHSNRSYLSFVLTNLHVFEQGGHIKGPPDYVSIIFPTWTTTTDKELEGAVRSSRPTCPATVVGTILDRAILGLVQPTAGHPRLPALTCPASTHHH